uniref:Uncharacterized protein n=1 Tax=Anguilla anguilla TaxID=7936 RepID=A0A0E9VP18_ANGAN
MSCLNLSHLHNSHLYKKPLLAYDNCCSSTDNNEVTIQIN